MNNEPILSLLTVQLDHVKQLEVLLNNEQQCLIVRDHQTIARLAIDKQALMSQLQTLDQQILEQASVPLSPQALTLKDQVMSLLSHCHRLNLENGKAIDLSIHSIERLQRSLIQKRAGNSMTYNAKGKTRGSRASSGYTSA